jgi:hypothetical protein
MKEQPPAHNPYEMTDSECFDSDEHYNHSETFTTNIKKKDDNQLLNLIKQTNTPSEEHLLLKNQNYSLKYQNPMRSAETKDENDLRGAIKTLIDSEINTVDDDEIDEKIYEEPEKENGEEEEEFKWEDDCPSIFHKAFKKKTSKTIKTIKEEAKEFEENVEYSSNEDEKKKESYANLPLNESDFNVERNKEEARKAILKEKEDYSFSNNSHFDSSDEEVDDEELWDKEKKRTIRMRNTQTTNKNIARVTKENNFLNKIDKEENKLSQRSINSKHELRIDVFNTEDILILKNPSTNFIKHGDSKETLKKTDQKSSKSSSVKDNPGNIRCGINIIKLEINGNKSDKSIKLKVESSEKSDRTKDLITKNDKEEDRLIIKTLLSTAKSQNSTPSDLINKNKSKSIKTDSRESENEIVFEGGNDKIFNLEREIEGERTKSSYKVQIKKSINSDKVTIDLIRQMINTFSLTAVFKLIKLPI